ncbi:hypothetical protein FB451DRAFT_1188571 [Mycena latifolia]|nr:hypothetical protein FB451DRAFT_1188571 [Mycena latifolia]
MAAGIFSNATEPRAMASLWDRFKELVFIDRAVTYEGIMGTVAPDLTRRKSAKVWFHAQVLGANASEGGLSPLPSWYIALEPEEFECPEMHRVICGMGLEPGSTLPEMERFSFLFKAPWWEKIIAYGPNSSCANFKKMSL